MRPICATGGVPVFPSVEVSYRQAVFRKMFQIVDEAYSCALFRLCAAVVCWFLWFCHVGWTVSVRFAFNHEAKQIEIFFQRITRGTV